MAEIWEISRIKNSFIGHGHTLFVYNNIMFITFYELYKNPKMGRTDRFS
jgi:hypothetical protein